MNTINKNIGYNLAKVRKARGLSLDQVSQLTKVSKGMLAQIEKGKSNPTISIIWKIVNGLQLSFTSLLEEDNVDISVVSYKNVEPITAQDGAFSSYPIFPFDARTRIEIYVVEMEPGCEQPSDSHNEGVEEYILVQEGSLSIAIGTEKYHLTTGQAIRFAAAVPHRYINPSDVLARFHVTISYT
jgi:transcriptional regulator with XRE-family HTH domain